MTLIVMRGFPGSGKSTIARALAERTGWNLIQSDVIRTELFPQGRSYTPAEHAATFGEVHRRIEAAFQRGESVIYDATNLTRRNRAGATKIAVRYHVPFFVFGVILHRDLLRKRIEARGADENGSEATVAVMEKMWDAGKPEDFLGCIPISGGNLVELNVDFILARINYENAVYMMNPDPHQDARISEAGWKRITEGDADEEIPEWGVIK